MFHNPKKLRMFRSGFTLIELLVVVAIIGLLASDNTNVYPAAIAGLAPTYIPAVPTDPNGVGYSYCRGTNTRTYGLGITIEEAGSDITKGSVALANMPAGCTASTNFTPNIACEATSGTATRYCVRS